MIVPKRKHRVLTSFQELFLNLFRKPATVKYPLEHVPVPENLRGSPELSFPDKCIACWRCVRECPTHCIKYTVINEETHEYDMEFVLNQCMQCGVCAEVCSAQAISMTPKWELAEIDKGSQTLLYRVRRPVKKKKKVE